MKKKKVLLFTDNFDPRAGGAEEVFFQLKHELEKDRSLDVYSFGFGEEKTEKNSKVFSESNSIFLRHLNRIFFNPIKYRELRKSIEKINPDIIHLHNINKYTISLLKACRGFKTIQSVHDYSLVDPTLWNTHSDNNVCKEGFSNSCFREHKRDYFLPIYLSQIYFFRKRNRLLKKQIKTFTTPSKELSQSMEKAGFENVITIPNFIDIASSKPYFDKIEKNSFLYVGKLEENKGVLILIDEFQKALKINPKLKLKIAGVGAFKNKLETEIKNRSLERSIKLLGWINPKEEYLRNQILIVPSIICESFGLVTAQAMANYRGVIGSNRGGTLSLIDDGKTGLIFDPTKKGDLAKKILSIDNKSVKDYGDASYKKIKGFISKKQIIKDIIKLY